MFKTRSIPEIRWIKIPEIERAAHNAPEALVLRERLRAPASAIRTGEGLRGFRELIATVGVPSIAGLTPEQELVALLQHASEIEHGLMLQYLYASYSRSDDVGPTLRFIAVEEMGHLLTVQNALLACGEKPYLAQGDWTNPSKATPFAFRLEPASSGSLAKYAVVEMPDPDGGAISDAQRETLKAIVPAATASAGHDVQERRVGLLYAHVYWLLRENDLPKSDPSQEPWTDFPVAEFAARMPGRHISGAFLRWDARQGTHDHWAGADQQTVIVRTIGNRDDALKAIAEVSAQGEGFGSSPDGHFDRFVDAWTALTAAGAPPSADMAINPWYKGGASAGRPAAGDEIASTLGVPFARGGDAAYEFTLLLIGLYLLLPATVDASLRASIAGGALQCMTDCLAKLVRNLRSLPLADTGSARMCGPPFAINGANDSSEVEALVVRGRAAIAEMTRSVNEIIASPQSSAGQRTAATRIARIARDDLTPILDAIDALG